MKAVSKPLKNKELYRHDPFCVDVLGRAVQKECRKAAA